MSSLIYHFSFALRLPKETDLSSVDLHVNIKWIEMIAFVNVF